MAISRLDLRALSNDWPIAKVFLLFSRREWALGLSLFLIWALMVALVNPLGDFPLNDDWSFARTVKTLVEEGRLRFTGWGEMTMITQILWGALFCLPDGFSFNALRLSTLIMGLLGIWVTYKIIREINGNQSLGFFASLIVMTNPLYFQLSNSFMTDVPFFSLSMVSFFFFIRFLNKENNIDLFAGACMSCLATLIRQLGIVIPASFFVAYILTSPMNVKNIVKSILPGVVVTLSLISYLLWLSLTQGIPDQYSIHSNALIGSLLKGWLYLFQKFRYNTFVAFLYMGLFSLPILLVSFLTEWQFYSYKKRILFLFMVLSVSIAIMVKILSLDKLMPLGGNLLIDFGLGPTTLSDYYMKNQNLPTAPESFWIVVTGICVIGSLLILQCIYASFNKIFKSNSIYDKRVILLSISACALYFLPFGMTEYYDRYLIFIIPLLIIVVIKSRRDWNLFENKKAVIAGYAIVVLYAFFSIAATHDYLSWNRVRWIALRNLLEIDRVPARRIDGGFEFNGWYLYDLAYKTKDRIGDPGAHVENADYIVTFGLIPGYKEVKRFPYQTWLSFKNRNVFVLRRLGY